MRSLGIIFLGLGVALGFRCNEVGSHNKGGEIVRIKKVRSLLNEIADHGNLVTRSRYLGQDSIHLWIEYYPTRKGTKFDTLAGESAIKISPKWVFVSDSLVLVENVFHANDTSKYLDGRGLIYASRIGKSPKISSTITIYDTKNCKLVEVENSDYSEIFQEMQLYGGKYSWIEYFFIEEFDALEDSILYKIDSICHLSNCF